MDTLTKLFGSSAIVKILRMFLFNPDEGFEARDVVKRTKVDIDVVRTELAMLIKIGFIKPKSFFKDIETSVRRRTKVNSKEAAPRRKRVKGWTLDEKFPYVKELQALLIGSAPVWSPDIMGRLKRAGNIKLVITSGVFVGNLESRLDIMVVGDNIRRPHLANSIKDIEAELGREIRYAVFTTSDFKYRLSIYDRLVRDVLDYRHDTVIDRLGITQQHVQ